jgi:hypothetical protein
MDLLSIPGVKRRLPDIAYILLNGTIGVNLRRRRYISREQWLQRIPRRVQQTFGLLEPVTQELCLEIGSGLFPTPGFVHLDASRWVPHVELVARTHRIPLPSKSVSRLLAVHVLEHVHPRNVQTTLIEWFRVMRPGGIVEIHVPDVIGLTETYATASVQSKWTLSSAIYGCYVSPKITDPTKIPTRADHQAMYDICMLEHLLTSAGFAAFRDARDTIRDRHDEAWSSLTPRFSLIVTAERPFV